MTVRSGKTEDNRPWYKWVCSYASYVLLLMLLTYLLNQLDRYMLAITSQSLARDVHFGDKACFHNTTLAAHLSNGTACNATTSARCVLHVYATYCRPTCSVCVCVVGGEGVCVCLYLCVYVCLSVCVCDQRGRVQRHHSSKVHATQGLFLAPVISH